MAKLNLCRLLRTIQLIFVVVSILSNEVHGNFIGGLKKITRTVVRSVARAPSLLMDGGQIATQKVVGGIGKILGPVKPLKHMVNAGGGAVSNLLGSTSRLLGKPVRPSHEVIFLYDQPLAKLGTSHQYQLALRTVIGQALFNVVLHPDVMRLPGKPLDPVTMPVMDLVARALLECGASDQDIEIIVHVLGRNGMADLPEELVTPVMGILRHPNGKFRSDGPMDQLRWISENPNGFYKLTDKQRTDYNLKTKNKYSRCVVIYPPIFNYKD